MKGASQGQRNPTAAPSIIPPTLRGATAKQLVCCRSFAGTHPSGYNADASCIEWIVGLLPKKDSVADTRYGR
jgi:hypothetical protein